eukprot:RCo045266
MLAKFKSGRSGDGNLTVENGRFQHRHPMAYTQLVMLQALARGWLARRRAKELRARQLLMQYNVTHGGPPMPLSPAEGSHGDDTSVMEPEGQKMAPSPRTPHEWNLEVFHRLSSVVVSIQKVWRGFLGRRRVQALRKALLQLELDA